MGRKYDYMAFEAKVIYKRKATNMKMLSNSENVFNYVAGILDYNEPYREEVYALMTNRKNQVIAWHRISQGGLTGTVIDPRVVGKMCVETMAVGVFIIHTHPSGNPEPSLSDIKLTEKLDKALNYLDISLIDHLIIGDINQKIYYSFRDEGKL